MVPTRIESTSSSGLHNHTAMSKVTAMLVGILLGVAHLIVCSCKAPVAGLAWSTHQAAAVLNTVWHWFMPRGCFTLRCRVGGVDCFAMIDSGASGCYISRRLVQRLNLKPCTVPDSCGYRVKFADGRTQSCVDVLPRLKLVLGGSYRTCLKFVVVDMDHDIIIGHDWLTAVNPSIDWKAGTVCIHTKNSSIVLHAYRPAPTAPLEPCLPAEHNLQCSVITPLQLKRLLRKPGHSLFALVPQLITPASLSTADDSSHALFGLNAISNSQSNNTNTASSSDTPEPSIPMSGHASVDTILTKHASVFQSLTGLPPERHIQFSIDELPGYSPPFRAPYRLSPPQLAEVRRQLDDFMAKGWIRPACSPYGAPIMVVLKKTGDMRIVLDYRQLNAQTVKLHYPLPRIDDLLDATSGATVFSKLDLQSGYYQIRMHPDSVPKTAFVTPYGQFEWLVMPMGVTGAPSVFQMQMQTMLGPLLHKCVVVYLDDILVYSKSIEEHAEHLDAVLSLMSEHGFYAKPSKCMFAVPEISFLGHVLSAAGVSPEKDKMQAVLDWPVPTDQHQLRSFLGLVGYYRRFIPAFSHVAFPLFQLLKGNVATRFGSSLWGHEQQHAFDRLKHLMVSAPILKVYDPLRPLVLCADASDYAFGSVLMQEYDGVLHPVCYYSRKFTAAEVNYPVHDREFLAIIDSIKTWMHYVEGVALTIKSDHKSLRHFWQQTTLSKRQIRWLDAIQHLDLHIEYIPGKDNVLADALSRRPDLQGGEEQQSVEDLSPDEKAVMSAAPMTAATSGFWEALKDAIATDELGKIWLRKPPPGFLAEDGVLYRVMVDGLRIWIPKSATKIQRLLIQEAHDSMSGGHMGNAATYNKLRRQFTWDGISVDVATYVRSCHNCQVNKSSTLAPAGLLQPMPVPERKWQVISLDFMTDFPVTKDQYDSCLVVVDKLTKFVVCCPTTKHVDAYGVAQLLMKHVVVPYGGFPEVIISDRDRKFTSHLWQQLFTAMGARFAMSSSYHAETDGQTERTNRVVQQVLRCYAMEHDSSWDELLHIAQYVINTNVHTSTKYSPYELMFGMQPCLPSVLAAPPNRSHSVAAVDEMLTSMYTSLAQAKKHLAAAQQAQAAYANKWRRHVEYAVGDLVLLSTENLNIKLCKKLKPRFVGPFPVDVVVNPVAIKLKLPRSIGLHPVVHVSQVKRYVARQPDTTATVAPSTDIIVVEDGIEYRVVHSIVDHRVVQEHGKDVYEYLVKYDGQSLHDCEYLRTDRLAKARDILYAYIKLHHIPDVLPPGEDAPALIDTHLDTFSSDDD